jgi:hypothetical protein
MMKQLETRPSLTTDQKVSGSTPDGCASKIKDLSPGELGLRFCTILFREGNSVQPAILPIMEEPEFLALLSGISRCFFCRLASKTYL